MLSIVNIGFNQAASYYDKDDYYTRQSDKNDEWQGELAEEYKHNKDFDPKDFDAALKSMASPKRVGYDLTFSAPKSVSIAMALDDEKKADMLAAHQQAVKDTLKEIEKHEIEAKVTKNHITERVKTGKMAVAKFNHYVSREQDMQLHTHCVILNRTEYQGKSYAIANENLYKNKILYGQLYRNRLAYNLQKMGYSCHVTNSDKGFFELDGIEQKQIDDFSKRRSQIKEKLKQNQDFSAQAASKATVLTRKAKENKDLGLLEQSWREQIGDSIKITKGNITINPDEKANAFDRGLDRLSERSFAFSRTDLEKAVLAEGTTTGMLRKDFTRIINRALKNDNVLVLGKLQNSPDETIYYSTLENIQADKEITKNTVFADNTSIISNVKNDLDTLIKSKGLTLSEEQQAAIIGIASNGKKYTAVQGLAGTGKTYMLQSAKQIFEQHGYKVHGMAFTGKAAEGLEEAGIKSLTIHSFLNRLEKEANPNLVADAKAIKKNWDFNGLKPKDRELWVVDEAGTLNNNLFLNLQKAAIARNAKVILVGDNRQFVPIGNGNAFEKLVNNKQIDTYYLSDIRRQKNEVLLEAVKQSVDGDINKSIDLLAKDMTEINSNPKRLKAMAKEYTSLSKEEQDNSVILTAKNADKLVINNLVRDRLLKAGVLNIDNQHEFDMFTDQDEKSIVSRKFCPGDKVIFLKNDHRLGLKNGQLGKIISINNNIMHIVSGKKNYYINTNNYKHIDHGYALTSYKSQGMTVDKAIVNIDSKQPKLNSRNAFYVNISRARNGVSVYTDNKEKISKQINKWQNKINSDDFLIENFGLKDGDSRKQVEYENYSNTIKPAVSVVSDAKTMLHRTLDVGLAIRVHNNFEKNATKKTNTNTKQAGMKHSSGAHM